MTSLDDEEALLDETLDKMLSQIDQQTIKLELFEQSLILLKTEFTSLMNQLDACTVISTQKQKIKNDIENLKKSIAKLRQNGTEKVVTDGKHSTEEEKD